MVKRFLKQPGGVGQYGEVSVEWHPGHQPELMVMDGDRVVSGPIDLAGYTYNGLHTLFESHFTKKATEAPAPISTPHRRSIVPPSRRPKRNRLRLPVRRNEQTQYTHMGTP